MNTIINLVLIISFFVGIIYFVKIILLLPKGDIKNQMELEKLNKTIRK